MVSRDEEPIISYAEERLWVVDTIEKNRPPFYNIPIGIRLVGNVDHGRMEKALSMLFARHDVLRSNIVNVGGKPVQHIGDLHELRLRTKECANEHAAIQFIDIRQ